MTTMPFNLLQPQPAAGAAASPLGGIGAPPGGLAPMPQTPGAQPGQPPLQAIIQALAGLAPGMMAGGGPGGMGAMAGILGGLAGKTMMPQQAADTMPQPPGLPPTSPLAALMKSPLPPGGFF